jgi:uncharacterized membrane protein
MQEIEIKPLPDKRAGFYCYLFGVLFALIFLTMKSYRSDRFLRFHAFQSIIFFLAFFLWSVISRVGHIIDDWITLAFFVAWIVLMVTAYKRKMFKLPLIGNLASYFATLGLSKA